MSKRHPTEVREKALRLALGHLDEYLSDYAAAHADGRHAPGNTPSVR